MKSDVFGKKLEKSGGGNFQENGIPGKWGRSRCFVMLSEMRSYVNLLCQLSKGNRGVGWTLI